MTNAQNNINPKIAATMMELFSMSFFRHSSLLKPQLGSSSGRFTPGHSIVKLCDLNLYSYACGSQTVYYTCENRTPPVRSKGTYQIFAMIKLGHRNHRVRAAEIRFVQSKLKILRLQGYHRVITFRIAVFV